MFNFPFGLVKFTSIVHHSTKTWKTFLGHELDDVRHQDFVQILWSGEVNVFSYVSGFLLLRVLHHTGSWPHLPWTCSNLSTFIAGIVGKRAVGIRLKCLLVTVDIALSFVFSQCEQALTYVHYIWQVRCRQSSHRNSTGAASWKPWIATSYWFLTGGRD